MAQKYAQESAMAQVAINQVEAAHKSLFVSWLATCRGLGVRLGMFGNFITIPFSNFVLALLGIDIVIPLSSFGDHDACAYGYAWTGSNENLREEKCGA